MTITRKTQFNHTFRNFSVFSSIPDHLFTIRNTSVITHCYTNNYSIDDLNAYIKNLHIYFSLDYNRSDRYKVLFQLLVTHTMIYLLNSSDMMEKVSLLKRPFQIPVFLSSVLSAIAVQVRSSNAIDGTSFGFLNSGSSVADINTFVNDLTSTSVRTALEGCPLDCLSINEIEKALHLYKTFIKKLSQTTEDNKFIPMVFEHFEHYNLLFRKPIKMTNTVFNFSSKMLGIYRFRNAPSEGTFFVQQHSLKLSSPTLLMFFSFLGIFKPVFLHGKSKSQNLESIAGDITLTVSEASPSDNWAIYLASDYGFANPDSSKKSNSVNVKSKESSVMSKPNPVVPVTNSGLINTSVSYKSDGCVMFSPSGSPIYSMTYDNNLENYYYYINKTLEDMHFERLKDVSLGKL